MKQVIKVRGLAGSCPIGDPALNEAWSGEAKANPVMCLLLPFGIDSPKSALKSALLHSTVHYAPCLLAHWQLRDYGYGASKKWRHVTIYTSQ